MGKLSRKLRIGEKIGFGFGIVGLLFLGVIWQYHATLQHALADYRQLHDIYGVRKSQALEIENSILRAQRSEKNFILSRDEASADDVLMGLKEALGAAAALEMVDDSTAPAAKPIKELIGDYQQRFQSVVAAWRIKGLDHNSGLQGDFRDSIHQLESMAEQFDVDRLYLLLLQIRRSEKDLGLRREQQYRERVSQLIQLFSGQIASSGLDDGLQARLFHEIEIYRETFGQYADEVLSDPQPHGGKGPFRQAAHRIESLLEAHYLPGLGENILQVRRREKDYLLRHDTQYVDMAIDELDQIVLQLEAATISAEAKQRFIFLLGNYRRDFLALVKQNEHISRLHQQMLVAVSEIDELVETNVSNADQAMTAMRLSIDESTVSSERALLWVVVVATLLGIFLGFAITLPIARPLRRMAGLLDHLASEEPVERVHFYPGGRDEVNAMAGSVNAMADHKAGFLAWWEASMREADACGRFEELVKKPHSAADRQGAEEEYRQAVLARRELLWEQYNQMHHFIERIIARTEGLLKHSRSANTDIELNSIRYSARTAQTILEMASAPEIWKSSTR